jgi:hypothetical protein
MLNIVSVVVLNLSVKATIGVSELLSSAGVSNVSVPTITPRCDFVNALRGTSGQDKFQQFIENFYGLVMQYLPLIVIGLIIALAAVVAFAVRRRLIPSVIAGVITLVFLGSIVGAVGNIGGTGPCPAG